MNRLTRFLPLRQFFLAPSMAGGQQTPPCSRCGASRNGQVPNTELCATCSQAASVQVPSTPAGSSQGPSTRVASSAEVSPAQVERTQVPSIHTQSSESPVNAPPPYKAPGPWREMRRDSDDESARASRHASEDRVWNAEYQKITYREEAQAARQEKWLRKSIECEQRLSESPTALQAPSEDGDLSDRSQRERAPTPSPVPSPPSVVIPAVPAPPAPYPSQDGHQPPSLVPAPTSASVPALANDEQAEAIPQTPSTGSDIPFDPKDKQHPPAPIVPATSPQPQRNMKLTAACANCKRLKTRCIHRRAIDENGSVVTDAGPSAPPKKRKRDDEPYIPAESPSLDSSAPPPAKRVLRLRPPNPPNTPEAGPSRPQLVSAPKAQGEKRPRGRPRKHKADGSENESECDSVKPPPAKRGAMDKGKAKARQESTPPSGQGVSATMTGLGDDVEFDVAMRRKLQKKLAACRKNLQATLDAVREAEQVLQEWFDAREEQE